MYGGRIYTASRASIPERAHMWREFRTKGYMITSRWIDVAGEGEISDYRDLWVGIVNEISIANKLVLYAEAGDFPLKGATVEVGIAIGMNIPVVICLPGMVLDSGNCRPIGSWINLPCVTRIDDIQEAMDYMPVT